MRMSILRIVRYKFSDRNRHPTTRFDLLMSQKNITALFLSFSFSVSRFHRRFAIVVHLKRKFRYTHMNRSEILYFTIYWCVLWWHKPIPIKAKVFSFCLFFARSVKRIRKTASIQINIEMKVKVLKKRFIFIFFCLRFNALSFLVASKFYFKLDAFDIISDVVFKCSTVGFDVFGSRVLVFECWSKRNRNEKDWKAPQKPITRIYMRTHVKHSLGELVKSVWKSSTCTQTFKMYSLVWMEWAKRCE